jgi:Xaa-Pro aminopeptidase
VLNSQSAALNAIRPGVSYLAVHQAARRSLTEGLTEIGILRGSADELAAKGAAALFFPHGVGHLLGLDVHDMEDLGDRAGYAPGRSRSTEFADRYLRLNRDLAPGMAVTIEPGFYQIPGILGPARTDKAFGSCVNWERLAAFNDVRGIRIEDDVLITDQGCEVLSAAIPKDIASVEAAVNG